MRRCRTLTLNMLLALMLMPIFTLGAETHLYAENVAPFAYRDGDAETGVSYELLLELSLRVGRGDRVEAVPLRRQLELVRCASDALGTLARFPDRESHYSWLVKLLEEDVVIVTRENSPADISSLDSARPLRVGVILGGLSEAVARHLGFAHIEAVPSISQNVHKLALGRIDAWIVGRGTARHLIAHPEPQVVPLRFGVTLERVGIYLAGGVNLAVEQAARWQTAFDDMRQDGSYARILKKYQYEPLK